MGHKSSKCEPLDSNVYEYRDPFASINNTIESLKEIGKSSLNKYGVKADDIMDNELFKRVRVLKQIGCDDDIMEVNQENFINENLFDLKLGQKLNKGHFGQVYTLNPKRYPYGKNKQIVVKSMKLKRIGDSTPKKGEEKVSILQALAELDLHIKAKTHVDKQKFLYVGIVDIYRFAVVDETNDRVLIFMEKTDTNTLLAEMRGKTKTFESFLENQEDFAKELYKLVHGLHEKKLYVTDIKMENAGFSIVDNTVKMNLYDLGPNFVEGTNQGYTPGYIPLEVVRALNEQKRPDVFYRMEKPNGDNGYNNSYFEAQVLLLEICSAGNFSALVKSSFNVCYYQKTPPPIYLTCKRMEEAYKSFRAVFKEMKNPTFKPEIKFQKEIMKPYSCETKGSVMK